MAHLREVKLLAAVYVALAINKRRKLKRKCWVKNWVRRRGQKGAYTQLIRELQLEDAHQFRNFTRMSAVEVQSLVNMLDPMTVKQKRNFIGGRGDTNTLLSGNRQVIHTVLICSHCNCMLAPMIFGF